jgi:hypothetical protein
MKMIAIKTFIGKVQMISGHNLDGLTSPTQMKDIIRNQN